MEDEYIQWLNDESSENNDENAEIPVKLHILHQCLDAAFDEDMDSVDHYQIKTNVLTIKHIKSVLSTYNCIQYLDIDKKLHDNIYIKNNYYLKIEYRISIVDSCINYTNKPKVVICDNLGLAIYHCKTKQELINCLKIIST